MFHDVFNYVTTPQKAKPLFIVNCLVLGTEDAVVPTPGA